MTEPQPLSVAAALLQGAEPSAGDCVSVEGCVTAIRVITPRLVMLELADTTESEESLVVVLRTKCEAELRPFLQLAHRGHRLHCLGALEINQDRRLCCLMHTGALHHDTPPLPIHLSRVTPKPIRRKCVDPRPMKLSSKQLRAIAWRAAHTNDPFTPPQQLQHLFGADFPLASPVWPQCSVVVGMHPDEATVPIVEACVEHRKPFAVVPCCVFWKTHPYRRVNGAPVRTYEQFCSFLLAMHTSLRIERLPFEGRNVVIFTDFGASDVA
eukprot:NODE_3469_length_962_cov_27.295808_g3319_i0.p1 GENE.NODE_3469_length_962_cov_27.295808_g3319_i0~~NODE_3469_length_962_cov_27.295808_g3319_i0.p1  ORF type:complete len:268 (-),score=46.98 NODE_3469_length_962_cov_27.295808_g3319_i0:98-901(-)